MQILQEQISVLAVVHQEREQAFRDFQFAEQLRRFLLNQIDQTTRQHHFYLVSRHLMFGFIGLVLGQVDYLDAISLANGIARIGNRKPVSLIDLVPIVRVGKYQRQNAEVA